MFELSPFFTIAVFIGSLVLVVLFITLVLGIFFFVYFIVDDIVDKKRQRELYYHELYDTSEVSGQDKGK